MPSLMVMSANFLVTRSFFPTSGILHTDEMKILQKNYERVDIALFHSSARTDVFHTLPSPPTAL
jgi:hypothetical protein